MTVSYNKKTSSVTIKLSLVEIRQFLSQSVAVEAVKDAVKEVMS